jgi:hypothetical protein
MELGLQTVRRFLPIGCDIEVRRPVEGLVEVFDVEDAGDAVGPDAGVHSAGEIPGAAF